MNDKGDKTGGGGKEESKGWKKLWKGNKAKRKAEQGGQETAGREVRAEGRGYGSNWKVDEVKRKEKGQRTWAEGKERTKEMRRGWKGKKKDAEPVQIKDNSIGKDR